MKKVCLAFSFFLVTIQVFAEDGYRLWLRYDKISNAKLLQQYRQQVRNVYCPRVSPTLEAAWQELNAGLEGLLQKKINTGNAGNSSLLVFSRQHIPAGFSMPAVNYDSLGAEGYAIISYKAAAGKAVIITGNTHIGVLYGVFYFLRLMQTHQSLEKLSVHSKPALQHRLLNHWDNLNRYVERGYAGISIFNWHTLPDYIDQRYIDYARANASIGINGTVLTNVNANALVLTRDYLVKVKALADVLRPYGIKVYLTARFSAPIEIGKLSTADPLNDSVKAWWNAKAQEIYQLIPDFGGFLVKANSEGQPGPQKYLRTHADGANMLANAVAPYGGMVMWRAFVYSNETPEDRFKQAYNEFKPLDGQFSSNVFVQVKNGPVDFQPREPVSPLFGAMPKTPLMMELQLTQEYLGQSTHLVYEAPMFKEIFETDTYRDGKGSTVARVIDGSLHRYTQTGIAGVANIGNDRNWTGHPFGQANWYAFGRLAWDNRLTAANIADEWVRQTFGNNIELVESIKSIMLASYEAMVNYMTPLGLNHIMGTGHHYGPAPWVTNAGRADWNPVYYHRADSTGLGFDRTATGSNALAQYAPAAQQQFLSIDSTPEKLLLWFHHVPWGFKMKSGRTLWAELCHRYYSGVDSVKAMHQQWDKLAGKVDQERFRQVQMLLAIQLKEAAWWRNACLLYFQTFSKMPIPDGYEKPDQALEYYMGQRFPYAPGNGL
ncbi:alpha-glucuronidase family glycosyl hydrolase [Foetidibacter luteolus]|uniref:alpha-glucuronidase family glycosyl hydrolase n=1 Tax=Foetidibacter luteolus TaxID=2608880 RepID=UPI00129A5273|nr:alpha-glucuronidase family glycosyl hydrolase [Foetidibacter luteolus]